MMFRGEGASGDHHKAESTEARYWDGAARSSDEASVMEVEQRGSVKPPECRSQLRRQEEDRCQAKPYDIDKWLVVEAYNRVKANAGAAGVDRQSLEDFDRDRRNNLYKLGTECLRVATCHLRSVLFQFQRSQEVSGCWAFRP